MERYKLFIKAKLRSFILIIIDKLIWLLGLSRKIYNTYEAENDKTRRIYYFSSLKVVRLDEISSHRYDRFSYPDIKTKDLKYPWEKLEKSIREHGILKPPHVEISKPSKDPSKKYYRYTLKDGNHRCLIWSYLHEYKNPYIKVHILLPFWEARIVDVMNPWDYPNLVSILFDTKDDLTLKQKNKNIKEIMKKREKELKSKTYGPNTDR
tara:strand:- start:1 stop:624 length:624 start_codon:yes stop_codon:yes gene_type:complete